MPSEYATFETSDPAAETNGRDARPAARTLVEKVTDALRLKAPASVSAIAEFNDYGWEFSLQVGGARVWCMVQRSDAWLLITELRPSLMDRLRGRKWTKEYGGAVALLDEALRSTGVSELRWYSRAEFEAQGRRR